MPTATLFLWGGRCPPIQGWEAYATTARFHDELGIVEDVTGEGATFLLHSTGGELELSDLAPNVHESAYRVRGAESFGGRLAFVAARTLNVGLLEDPDFAVDAISFGGEDVTTPCARRTPGAS